MQKEQPRICIHFAFICIGLRSAEPAPLLVHPSPGVGEGAPPGPLLWRRGGGCSLRRTQPLPRAAGAGGGGGIVSPEVPHSLEKLPMGRRVRLRFPEGHFLSYAMSLLR